MAEGETMFKQALDQAEEIELVVTGRRSGRSTSRPVWFVHDDRRIGLIPIGGTDSAWFKNVLADPEVGLKVGDQELRAVATPITDADKVHDVIEKFRRKYGASEFKRYYSHLNAAVEVPLT
jgi:deazaflavin-dependent oxidoreductase (nitroreductase family)